MSTADLLERVGDVSRSTNPPHVMALPSAGQASSRDRPDASCPEGYLTWRRGSGRLVWSSGADREETTPVAAAGRLADCDALEVRFTVLFSRFYFTVHLDDGRIREVGPLDGHAD
jgi:hypothetical protein